MDAHAEQARLRPGRGGGQATRRARCSRAATSHHAPTRRKSQRTRTVPSERLEVDREGQSAVRPAGRRGEGPEPAEGQDGEGDPQPEDGRGVRRREPRGPAEGGGRGQAEKSQERAQDPEAKPERAVSRPPQRAGEKNSVLLAAGPPGRAPERLVEVDPGPASGRPAAPEAAPLRPREREGPRVEAVGQHDRDAGAQREPRPERLPGEEEENQGHRKEEEKAGQPVAAHTALAITAGSIGQPLPARPGADPGVECAA